MRRACAACGLDLSAQDAGDGPAVFVIFFLGLIVVGLAALVEIRFSPPIWVHLLLWTPLILGGAILMLRPLKAGLIALQYRHQLWLRRHDSQLERASMPVSAAALADAVHGAGAAAVPRARRLAD